MPGRVLRLDDRSFRFLVIGVGLSWSVAFAVIPLFTSSSSMATARCFPTQLRSRMSGHSIGIISPAECRSSCSPCCRPNDRRSHGQTLGWNHRLRAALLYFSAGGTDRDLCGRSLTRPHHLRLCLLFDSPALPADLRLSDRDVAGPRDILARVGARPLCEAHRAGAILVFSA